MSFQNLRKYIEHLEKSGDLKRIKSPISPELEITEIASRYMKTQSPALLFENVKGFNIPVLINAFGSRNRIKTILNTDDYGKILGEFIDEFQKHKTSLSFLDKIKSLPKLKAISDVFPQVVSKAPCQEVIDEAPDFSKFPILKCWPEDGGAYLTLPLVFTKDPDTGIQNCGIYRMQVYDNTTSGMHWHINKGGAEHYRKYQALNQRMPVSVAVGGDPAITFAACCPLPPDIDEMIFAGFTQKKPVEMVKSITNDILVPAESEIIFEGYVDPNEERLEGPFGDHTGFYSLPDMYPVFHLTAITHRKNPIYLATVVGRPPMEDCYIGEAITEIFKPIIKKQLPEIVDMHMPFSGVFHNLLLVSIKKAYPGHARKVMHALWGMGQMAVTKVIVVVDDDINLKDSDEVIWKALNNIDPQRDIEFVMGPLDALDHASRLPNYGSKAGIDATKKLAGEGFTRPWPNEIKMTQDIIDKINKIWNDL